MTPALRWSALVLLLAAFGFLVQAHPSTIAPDALSVVEGQEGGERKFTISAHKYAFSPARIEVRQDDLVRVTFSTTDIPHSFTIDRYRIAKRVEPGKPIVFEFRADQPGRVPIYCNRAADERCKEMVGELVVGGK